LGLAGVAARSGVKTTLGTLWFINDAATVPLIGDFYQALSGGKSKVVALQEAQLRQIREYRNPPAIWSPFVLIGNWL
jgi:CHAT domain-containing protein